MYKPNPIKTEHVTLPKEVEDLLERLAENAHENWALQRIEDGWIHGETRNDEKKTHPCLVPYDQLSETEKNYDRLLSEETLKTILSLGYNIENK